MMSLCSWLSSISSWVAISNSVDGPTDVAVPIVLVPHTNDWRYTNNKRSE